MRRLPSWWLLAALPALATLVLAWYYASGAPEPAAWREYVREPRAVLRAEFGSDFGGMPNHVVGRGLHLLLLATGLPLERLALLGWVVACAAVLAVLRLARTPQAAPVLALVAFSPAFAADWLLVERLRVFLPAACAAGGVLLLQGPPRVARCVGALLLALGAVFVHETGALIWVALLPALLAAARQAGWRLVPALGGWCLAGNLALALCYDESARIGPGLLAGLGTQPLATLDFCARVLAQGLPDLLPETDVDAWLVAPVLLLAFAVAALRGAAPAWLSLAGAGLVQALAVAHIQYPSTVAEQVLREMAWGVWLLPAGLVGAAAAAAPQLARRAAPAAAALLVVLAAQDWQRGLRWGRTEAGLLQQGEALLVFAELGRDVLPGMPQVPVEAAADRQALRAAGCLRRALPLADRALTGLPRLTAPVAVGELVAAGPAGVSGTFRRDAAGGDLVLVMRQRGEAAPVLCQIAAPNLLAADPVLAWSASFQEAEPFLPGDVVSAFAFDLRRRGLFPLRGRFRWQDGSFAAMESGQ